MHVGHQSFFFFCRFFFGFGRLVSVGLPVPVPSDARVLHLAVVDAAICKTENKAQDLVYRDIEQQKGYEVHTSTSFHYARDGMSVSLRNVSKLWQ